ncbi:MAG: response regulator transcription factor [Saprospiraceae bacterium]|nr:response regulator transcription factor [Saprospiraceae bacterium]
MKILLVEDQVRIMDSVVRGLEAQGMQVDWAKNGQEGFERAVAEHYDLVISDVMMPRMTGVEMVTRLRKQQYAGPILLLTGMGEVDQKIAGLEAGADDYLTKPFDMGELVARVHALVRRSQGVHSRHAVLRIGDLEVDPQARTVRRNEQPIQLTQKEFELLLYLVRHVGRVISKKEIAEQVWDIHFDSSTNVIEVYMSYLRNKVDKPFSHPLIHTSFGVGYVLRPPDEAV